MIRSMLDYIYNSPDSFHAVKNIADMLSGEGYTKLTPGDWELKQGGKYYTTLNGSSIIAFRIPSCEPEGLMLTASHSDAPCLKIRNSAELDGSYLRLSVERYGGMINNTWLDRPLSIAGRVIVKSEKGIEEKLVNFKKDMAVIPNVAIHFNRSVNDGVKCNASADLVPLFGGTRGRLKGEIAELIGCNAQDILSTELCLYNNQSAGTFGQDDEYVYSPRLDDLACAYSCTKGFLDAKEGNTIPLLCVFDNEEIGSGTKQGAESVFLSDVLSAITEGLSLSAGKRRKLVHNSFMLSCDNAHALHPNHPEYSDRLEAPVLNGGVVIKHSPKYATDAVSSALFESICRRAGIAVQHYSNNPDSAGGSTLGNIATTGVTTYCADVGIAQLAMHSACETMGRLDGEDFIKAMTAFYESGVKFEEDGIRIS